jgi:Fe-S-cluster containining protein
MSRERKKDKMTSRRLGQGKPGAADLPTDLGGFELDLRRSQRLEAAEVLQSGRTPLKLIEVADKAATLTERAIDDIKQRHPPPPLACQEGCDWCCYFTVGTNVPEVVRIVAYLQERLSPEEYAALSERVARQAEQKRIAKTTAGDPERLPCPLLVDHRCSVYPVRPLTCRGCNSRDAEACHRSVLQRGRIDVPMYVPQQRLTAFALDGVNAGLTQSRLAGDILELTAALEIGLKTPDAATRWLAGEAVFAPARHLRS